MSLLKINKLTLEFGVGSGAVRALEGVSFEVNEGETLALVGESGSGKSITALSIAQLVPAPPARYVGGEILLEGKDVLRMNSAELRGIRGRVVSYIFQEPGGSLNPVIRIGSQIKETLKLHQPALATDGEVVRLLDTVGISSAETRLRSFPHEMSGGMQQRVMIAMALASRPKLLVADEPTTALDVTIQAQIIELLQKLKQQFRMAILLITHNLGIVGDIAEHAAVMYAGQIVETGPAQEMLRNPLHPYTRALVSAVPIIGAEAHRLKTIPGAVPRLGALPSGCRFHPRCSLAQPRCSQAPVEIQETSPGRWVRCPYVS